MAYVPSVALRSFLEIPYDELEALNLEAKKKAYDMVPEKEVEAFYTKYLKNEKRIKAITLAFTDVEGRLHILDFDKNHFLGSPENLTFDGSSIRGFSELENSDLRLLPDWHSFRWLPADIFGPGKVMMFGIVAEKDGTPYEGDLRGRLKRYLEDLNKKEGMRYFTAPELEGFLLEGANAEQYFDEKVGFTLATKGGYFHALPQDKLRQFIDKVAEAQRALGFENEKDHPEVAPSQFELNYKYTDAVLSSDQIQMYKIIARQVARSMDMTASFLPKPIVGINGSGMHINLSISKNGKNIFYDAKGKETLSTLAWDFISRILNHANEICLLLNASVNAYRRLDPNFEAPNQIKVSPTDRSSMIRIPIGNEKSTRIEMRSVGPDANPYLVSYALLRTGLEGDKLIEDTEKRPRVRILPGTISDAIRHCKTSDFVSKILNEDVKAKYIGYKQAAADRSPSSLGTRVKNGEILYNHEVTNQVLWNAF